ncbi:MAG: helix-turn-helix domain-containing protein [Planctomycetota bacterium]
MTSPINLADLGRRIRAARLSRRLTLEEVVSRTDFTVSWLSKLENGLLAPSLEGLVRLAEVLECGVEHLVAGLSVAPRFVVDRAGEGWKPAGRQGLTVEHLATAWRQRAMTPAILHLTGTGNRKAPEVFEGERFLHIVDGEVKVTYGDELILLTAGDSIYIDASLPHSLIPSGRGSARALSVVFEPNRNGHAPGKDRADAGRTRRARAGGQSPS